MSVDTARLRDLLAAASPLPWKSVDLPYNKFDDPCILDANDVYVAQTAYDMQSYSTDHPVDDDTLLIVEGINAMPALLDRIDALTVEIATAEQAAYERAAIVVTAIESPFDQHSDENGVQCWRIHAVNLQGGFLNGFGSDQLWRRRPGC